MIRPDHKLAFLIAVMLLDGSLSFAAAHDPRRTQDPKVTAMRRRIELVGDPTMGRSVADRRARVELTMRDGRVLAQGMLTYTSPGAEADLAVTTAVDIRVRKEERETRRALAEAASKYLGQRIIVENRTGAAGTLGAASLVNARPSSR